MSKNYSFTLNNYTEEDYDDLLKNDYFQYVIIGKEKGSKKGTEHLQGYFQLKKKNRLQWIKRHINDKMHVEKSKGTPEQNKVYCSKDKNFEERGTMITQGSNTARLYDDIQECLTWGEVLRLPGAATRLNYCREVWNNKPLPHMDKPEQWKPWQERIISLISQDADDRTIIWVYDKQGGKGKTFLGKYLMLNHDAFYCNPSKGDNLLHAYNNERVIIYDIPRSLDAEYINCGVLEQFKNGIVFSGKYQSQTKVRKQNAHVIVMSNQLPPEGKFSSDRIHLITV